MIEIVVCNDFDFTIHPKMEAELREKGFVDYRAPGYTTYIWYKDGTAPISGAGKNYDSFDGNDSYLPQGSCGHK